MGYCKTFANAVIPSDSEESRFENTGQTRFLVPWLLSE